MNAQLLLLLTLLGFASTTLGLPEFDPHRTDEISCTTTATIPSKRTFTQLEPSSTDGISYITTRTSSVKTYDIPQLMPRGIGQIECKTKNTSPAEADLAFFGALAPFPDGRGFCLTLSAMCPGPFNNLCVDNPAPFETVRLEQRNDLIIDAVGRKRNMELLCSDVSSGLDSLRKKCATNGKVEGSIQYDGRNGKGYVTIHVKAA